MVSRLLLDGKKRGKLATRWIEHASTRLFGQPRIVEMFADVCERIEAGIRSEERPIAVILIYGPSGAGKTEAIKVFAEFLLGSRDALIRLDGPNYSERHEASNVKGSPSGYVGFDQAPAITQEKLDAPGLKKAFKDFRENLSPEDRKKLQSLESLEKEWFALMRRQQELFFGGKGKKGKITKEAELEAMRERLPKIWEQVQKMGYPVEGSYLSILHIDEIEKAHRDFHQVLLSIFDEGKLEISVSQDPDKYKGQGEVPQKIVRFTNTIIVGTANCGEEEIARLLRVITGREVRMGFGNTPLSIDEVDAEVYEIGKKELVKNFSTPFLGRLDHIIAARPLFPETVKDIFEKEIRELQTNLSTTLHFPIVIKVSSHVKEFIIREATDRLEEGARLLRKKVQHYLIDLIARLKNSGQLSENDVVEAELQKGPEGKDEIVFYRLPRTPGGTILIMKKE